MLPGKKYTPADIGQIAWRRRWYIAIPALVCFYAALVVSSQLTDQYQSEMLIQIVPQRVPDAYVRSTVTMRTEDRLNALTQQVLSRPELERLIREMNLYPKERAAMPMQDVVDLMRKNIAPEVVKSQRDTADAEAFYIRFTYPDRDLVTRVTERLGDLYIDVNARDRGALAEGTNNFLQTQLVQARQRLDEIDVKLKRFREMNAGRLPTQVDMNMQGVHNTQLQLQTLSESIARDRDRKLTQETLLAELQSQPSIAPLAVTAPSAGGDAVTVGASPQQQLAQQQGVLASLELKFKPEHPDVIRTKRRIQELERRVAEDEASGASREGDKPVVPALTAGEQSRRDRLTQMRAEIESLERQIRFKEGEEQRLRRTLDDYQRRIEATPGVETEWVALTRDYQTQQNAYTDLLSKSEQSKVAADLEKRQIGEQFRILDPARPPLRPTGVPRLEINAAGLAIGLILGLLIAALLEFFDRTFRHATEIRDVLRLPVLATVPHIEDAEDKARVRRWQMLRTATISVVALAAGYGFWALQLWRHLT
jgi:polysaccharide chain length determinant protein (PEP-CTERM system associated)